MRIHRRDFLAGFAALPAVAAPPDVIIGIQGYSFRDRSLDAAIEAARSLGVTHYELFQKHVEPGGLSRGELRRWRLGAPVAPLEAVREKFQKAGLTLWSCGYNIRADFTGEEIAWGFRMARALGVTRMNSSSNVSVAERIDRYASREKIYVGLHNHSNLAPDEFARAEDFERALRGRSPYLAINFDIGHATAAGLDAPRFIEQHHARILTLHLKDRKKNNGANVAWGRGDTPIREVLQLLKTKRYPIPALIEYEYPGEDTVTELRRCLDYCREALA